MRSLKRNRPNSGGVEASAAQRLRQTARLMRSEGASGVAARLLDPRRGDG